MKLWSGVGNVRESESSNEASLNGFGVADTEDVAGGTLPLHKPLLTVEQQIVHMKSKGITFELCSEADAAVYLREYNNYLRTASYRKLFPVHPEGSRIGLYVNLDFAYLKELSSLGRKLRDALLGIAVDVEHFAKIELLDRMVDEGEDGYGVVADFLRMRPRVVSGLRARAKFGERHDTYSGDLIAHYLECMPVWVLLEVVDFGGFIDFWLFCANRWDDAGMRQIHYILKSVKALRNACAHNSLVIQGLDAYTLPANYPTNRLISDSLNSHGMRNSRIRRAKMRNVRVSQFAAALWSSERFCRLATTRSRHARRLACARAFAESASFAKGSSAGANIAIVSFISFLWKLVDIWVPEQAK